MALLIVYLIVNVALSLFLEKSKYRLKLATVTHAAAFTVVLVFVLLSQDGVVGSVMERVLGEYYAPLHSAVAYGAVGMISPLMVIETVMPLLVITVSAVTAVKAVEYVRTRRAPFVRRSSSVCDFDTSGAFSPLCIDRIYIRNCVIRC